MTPMHAKTKDPQEFVSDHRAERIYTAELVTVISHVSPEAWSPHFLLPRRPPCDRINRNFEFDSRPVYPRGSVSQSTDAPRRERAEEEQGRGSKLHPEQVEITGNSIWNFLCRSTGVGRGGGLHDGIRAAPKLAHGNLVAYNSAGAAARRRARGPGDESRGRMWVGRRTPAELRFHGAATA